MALLTFKFQRVYCPEKREIVHLHDPETHELGPLLKKHTDLDFLGTQLDSDIAKQVAECVIDPITHENLKDMINKKEEESRLLHTQRTFIRKNKGLPKPGNIGLKKMKTEGSGGLRKFFGI